MRFKKKINHILKISIINIYKKYILFIKHDSSYLDKKKLLLISIKCEKI